MLKKRYRPEERGQLVAAFRASGLTQAEFASRAGITISALQNWLYSPKAKLVFEAPAAKEGFVRIVGAGDEIKGSVTVRFDDRVAIEFHEAPGAEYLAAMARALIC